MTIDGVRAEGITVALGDRRVPPAELTEDDGWWFQQDRVTLGRAHDLAPGAHDVAVEFGLRIPYLQVGPDGPLTLPFRAAQSLILDAPHALPGVVAARPRSRCRGGLQAIRPCPRAGCSARAPSTGRPR